MDAHSGRPNLCSTLINLMNSRKDILIKQEKDAEFRKKLAQENLQLQKQDRYQVTFHQAILKIRNESKNLADKFAVNHCVIPVSTPPEFIKQLKSDLKDYLIREGFSEDQITFAPSQEAKYDFTIGIKWVSDDE